jgi:hypothetical protein
VGFGQASVTDSFSYTVPARPAPRQPGQSPAAESSVVQQFRLYEGFFIFEPQATVVIRLTRGFAIDVAGGYRVVSGAGSYNSWLRGPSASIGVRFGPRI